MTSQITKDFKMKSRLRALADGGSVDPNMLGTGAAARAGNLLVGRGRQIDDAVDAATGTAAPAPAQQQQQVVQPTKKSGLRGLLGLADGGSYNAQLRDGGRVKGPGGPTGDKVGPVMLSNKEYVLPGDTADAIGRDKLDAIRLATHDFKSDRKESALRKRVGSDGDSDSDGRHDGDGDGDGRRGSAMPAPHLADGGSPKAVDPNDDVYLPNALGDVAAGPSYQQPGAVAQASSAGNPPPPAQVANKATDSTPNTPLAHIFDPGSSSSALRLIAPFANVAGNISSDLGGRIGHGMTSAFSGGKFMDGFTSPPDSGQRPAQQQPSTNAPSAPAAPAAAAPPVPVSDQGPAQPVAPSSYQSRRLSEMGVPMEVQNSNPVVDSVTDNTRNFLRTGGTKQYQNLGTYGGDGNIYGKADDPSRPSRINNFVGVGATASPSSGEQNPLMEAITSALRSPGGGSSASGAQSPNVDPEAAINARYDKIAEEIRKSYGPEDKGLYARRLAEIQQARAGELNSLRSTRTMHDDAQLNADTLRHTNAVTALAGMQNASMAREKEYAVARMRALQQAQQFQREVEKDGAAHLKQSLEQMYVTTDKNGNQVTNKEAAADLFSYIMGSNPMADKEFASMKPQEQDAWLQRFKVLHDIGTTADDVARRGHLFSANGGTTHYADLPTSLRGLEWNDVVNNGVPTWDYLLGKATGNNKAMVMESGRVVPLFRATNENGSPFSVRNLDVENVINQSVEAAQKAQSAQNVKAKQSALRNN